MSAVAAFSMIPGPCPEERLEPDLLRELEELPDVAAAGEVELCLDLLVVNPEDVDGDRVQPTGLKWEPRFGHNKTERAPRERQSARRTEQTA